MATNFAHGSSAYSFGGGNSANLGVPSGCMETKTNRLRDNLRQFQMTHTAASPGRRTLDGVFESRPMVRVNAARADIATPAPFSKHGLKHSDTIHRGKVYAKAEGAANKEA